ncbi:heavy metal translocating P-type ATPase [Acetobacteraceae bacterium KSS8]|uniref:Heavy metal translocating P-type ATPase n=1 Tax=Endosaccharibacter trunci TaxID=2812733 RepID=A0ABT1W7X7_9PROT|nr:heavy metal translocating P-type ATPase [Acetobacteraceae bacterium KSS8]
MDGATTIRRDVGLTELSCAACVKRVERVLGALPGVVSVSVNLATARASMDTGSDFELGTALAALDKAGYPASFEPVDLDVTGLSCAACVGRVERALKRVSGVREATVNLATGRARAMVATGLVTPEMLRRAVEAAGYGAVLPEANEGAAPARHRDRDGWIALGAVLVAAPLLLPMLLMPFGVHATLPALAQLALAAIVQFGFGARFYRGAFVALRNGGGNMDTLVALGSSAAFGLSLYAMVAAPDAPLYFEASAAVIALVRVGKWLEGKARRGAGSAIRALDRLTPERATIRDRDGSERSVPAGTLRPGDLLLVRPGERIAADAVLREGVGSCDESLLTGESMPVDKAPGDTLVGGALNGDAVLLAEVTAIGGESRLGRMVRLIEDAQAAKPPVQKLVDRVSNVFVPAVVGVAALTLLGWWLAGRGMELAIVRAVSVLVIACPCALGLATPAAMLAGIGAAARNGILIRDAAALEQAERIRTVAFDKTGTLTEGRPELVGLHAVPGRAVDDVLHLAEQLQRNSEHPLARAVRAAAPDASGAAAESVRSLPGRGTIGRVDERTLRMGNAAMMAEAGIAVAPLAAEAAALEAEGRTVSFLASGEAVLGVFGFADPLRAGAAGAVAALRRRGLRVALLTGDNQGAAEAAGRALALDDIQARVTPEGKAERVAALRAEGKVAMVGDGVNDAPALAAADLGLAMATGTDVAMEAAGITLMRGDPMLVPAALDIAGRTMRRIRSGLFWAFAYNVLGIPLAIAGLLSPVVAGAAMACSSVLVVCNALLLGRWQPGTGRPAR